MQGRRVKKSAQAKSPAWKTNKYVGHVFLTVFLACYIVPVLYFLGILDSESNIPSIILILVGVALTWIMIVTPSNKSSNRNK